MGELKNQSKSEQHAFMMKVWRQQEALENQEIEEVIELLKGGTVPTPSDAVEVIRSAISKRQHILSHHCFWKELKTREGLKSIIEVAHTSYVDICRHNAALVGLGKNYSVFEDQVDHMVSNPLQKDVMAFCAAAHGCIDTVRRLKKCRPDIVGLVDEAISNHLTGPVFEFIKSLRKNLSHGSVVIPSWTLVKDEDGISGSMVLSINDMLAFGEWSSGAKAYLKSIGKDKVDIAKAIGEYNAGLVKFTQTIDDILARSVTEAERDYYQIEDSYKRLASGQWKKILISQIGKGKDPYDFLHRYFKPEEVREILRKPKNSKEQVDYIISLRAVGTECDDDLRDKLYELFEAKG